MHILRVIKLRKNQINRINENISYASVMTTFHKFGKYYCVYTPKYSRHIMLRKKQS
jgi:hypothetical protein